MPELELSRQDPLEACCCFIFPWFKLFCGIKKIKTSPTSNFAIKRSKLRQCSAVGGAYLFIFLWYLQHHWHRRDWSFIRSASDDAGCLQDMFRHHIHGCRCACFFNITHKKEDTIYFFKDKIQHRQLLLQHRLDSFVYSTHSCPVRAHSVL